jgi:hypothetical protein
VTTIVYNFCKYFYVNKLFNLEQQPPPQSQQHSHNGLQLLQVVVMDNGNLTMTQASGSGNHQPQPPQRHRSLRPAMFRNLLVVILKLFAVRFSLSIQCTCDSSIFEKVFIWFLGQPVVWSEPNISQIEAWSSTIYAWYQEFEFEFF